jgi:nucleotide-binding universal stress UspA family protein
LAAEVTQGRPAERIVTRAWEIDADLTVLSSHGEGGLGSWNLGSTTQQVLALAPGSVLVVPPDLTAMQHVPAKRVVVAVDGSLRAQSVLPEVAQLARFHGLELLLVHVVAEPKPTAVLAREEDLRLARELAFRLQAGAERYLSELRERLFAEVEHVETVVLREMDERRALLEVADQQNADLVVLAAHGATCDAERPFGSFTAYALAHSRLPVLVLQDLPVKERDSFRPHAETTEGPSSIRASFDSRSPEEA